ncbi:MAG: FAD-dependent oxidoreductase [Clostridia bacterium]|nr:FAD-dependent oxidoreductase [Clostridia bacterium]
MFITEAVKQTPVLLNVDLCVVGGSCTGVFAAIRAARQGLTVALVESSNCFGGVAANGLVGVWHSLHDTDVNQQIIGGLTKEVLDTLNDRGVLYRGDERCAAYKFNSEQLKVLLDEMVAEHKNITPMLHTMYCGLQTENEKITAVFIQNKDGRSAIKAKFFIDATGDGDLCRDLGLERFTLPHMQPPTPCFKVQGDFRNVNVTEILQKHHSEVGLPEDWGWSFDFPQTTDISTRADTHVFDVNCAIASQLTYSEIEGRRQINAVLELLNKYGNGKYVLIDTCSYIGIRDTYHYKTDYQLTQEDLLYGTRFPDAVANSTYRVDVHDDNHGIKFKYLDGTTEEWTDRVTVKFGRWREPVENDPKFYQIPFKVMVQQKYHNFIMAGRMINADETAFGAVRVMVNLNQLGEAAGVAAAICVDENIAVHQVDAAKLRQTLKNGGSIML